MITNLGKTVIKNFFGGQTPRIGGSIAIGTGVGAAALADTKLNYEATRLPVKAIAADLDNNRIVFKATLPAGLVGTIYELGLYHNVRSGAPEGITLGAQTAAWDGGTLSTTNARGSIQTVRVDAAAGASNLASQGRYTFDLSTIAGTDSVSIGFFADANLSNVKVRLGVDVNNYREFTFSGVTAGYNAVRVNWSTGTNTGTVDLSAIRYVAVVATAKAAGATALYFDGLNIERNANADDLVARVVLATPKVVDPSLPTEIEYSLVINV